MLATATSSPVPSLRELLSDPTACGSQPEDRTDQGGSCDEEHDERLNHLYQVDRGARAGLHLHTACPEGTEEQTREHRAAGGGPGKQGNRDGVEAYAGVDVLGDRAVGTQDL